MTVKNSNQHFIEGVGNRKRMVERSSSIRPQSSMVTLALSNRSLRESTEATRLLFRETLL